MNKNILLRRRAQGNVPTLTKNVEKEKEVPVPDLKPTSKNRNKHNPDVMQIYEREKNNKMTNIEYSKEIWKGITGKTMNFEVDSSLSFVMPVEKPDHEKIQSDYIEEYNKREAERLEIERINKEIQEKMVQNVMRMTEVICGEEDVNIEDTMNFDELKLSTTNVDMKVEQDGYNQLLQDIGKL